MADAMEVSLLTFISTCSGVEWQLSDRDIANLSSCVFGGAMIGSLIFGQIADHFGRKYSYMIACLLISGGGFLSGASPTYRETSFIYESIISLFFQHSDWLLFFRFLVGLGIGGLSVPFDLLAEFLPAREKGRYLCMIQFFWTFGSMFVASLAWILLPIPSLGWRALTYLTALPVLLTFAFSFLLLPESPKWLASQGRSAESERVLRDVAEMNGHDILKGLTKGKGNQNQTNTYNLYNQSDCEEKVEVDREKEHEKGMDRERERESDRNREGERDGWGGTSMRNIHLTRRKWRLKPHSSPSLRDISSSSSLSATTTLTSHSPFRSIFSTNLTPSPLPLPSHNTTSYSHLSSHSSHELITTTQSSSSSYISNSNSNHHHHPTASSSPTSSLSDSIQGVELTASSSHSPHISFPFHSSYQPSPSSSLPQPYRQIQNNQKQQQQQPPPTNEITQQNQHSSLPLDLNNNNDNNDEFSWTSFFTLISSPSLSKISLPLWFVWLCFGFSYYGVILLVGRIYSTPPAPLQQTTDISSSTSTTSPSSSSSSSSSSRGSGLVCGFDYPQMLLSACSELIGSGMAVLIVEQGRRKRNSSQKEEEEKNLNMNRGRGGGIHFIIRTCKGLNRVQAQSLLYFLSALFTALIGSQGGGWGLSLISFCSRACISSALTLTWSLTPDLFPTRLRGTGHAIATAFTRFGAFLAPYLVDGGSGGGGGGEGVEGEGGERAGSGIYSHSYSVPVVSGVLAVVCLVASGLTLLLPKSNTSIEENEAEEEEGKDDNDQSLFDEPEGTLDIEGEKF